MPSDDQSPSHAGRSAARSHTRRDALKAGGAVLALSAGCLGSVSGDGASTETHTFPAPEPTSAAPTDPTPLSIASDWPRFQFDARNTGHDPGTTAVSEKREIHWHFYTQSTPPVVVGDALYTVERARARHLVERDAATGRQRWTTSLSGGEAGPPVVDGDRVFVQTYSTMHAFDRSGRKQWSHDVGRGSPGASVADGDTVYLCNGSFEGWSAKAFALARDDGSERWSVELDGDLRGSLALADDALYVGTEEGTLYALDAGDGGERWTVDLGGGVDSTAAVTDGAVYVVAGETAHALDADDGSERWTAPVGGAGGGTAPAVADGDVYVGTESGLYALGADDGSERWRYEAVGPATTPTVDDGTVYVGGTGFDSADVLALDRREGSPRWRLATERQAISDTVVGGVYGPPTPVEGGLYVTAADGLYALGPPPE